MAAAVAPAADPCGLRDLMRRLAQPGSVAEAAREVRDILEAPSLSPARKAQLVRHLHSLGALSLLLAAACSEPLSARQGGQRCAASWAALTVASAFAADPSRVASAMRDRSAAEMRVLLRRLATDFVLDDGRAVQAALALWQLVIGRTSAQDAHVSLIAHDAGETWGRMVAVLDPEGDPDLDDVWAYRVLMVLFAARSMLRCGPVVYQTLAADGTLPERAVAVARCALRVMTEAGAGRNVVGTLLLCASVVKQACHVLRGTRLRLFGGGGVPDGESLMAELRHALLGAVGGRRLVDALVMAVCEQAIIELSGSVAELVVLGGVDEGVIRGLERIAWSAPQGEKAQDREKAQDHVRRHAAEALRALREAYPVAWAEMDKRRRQRQNAPAPPSMLMTSPLFEASYANASGDEDESDDVVSPMLANPTPITA